MTPFMHPLYRHLEAMFEVEVALPVPRAALGLMAALLAWVKCGHAPAVALCANVCHDVVAAVSAAGCRPIFLDLDPATGLVPSEEWTRGRAAGASVALVVHLYGNPVDVSAARVAFPEGQCLVIDDAAQALGARLGDAQAGGQGDIGLLSFGPTKQIEGGGGVLLFRSRRLASDVTGQLQVIGPTDDATRAELLWRFRVRLERARANLRRSGVAAASSFSGLLDGYLPALTPAFPDGSSDIVLASLRDYGTASSVRIAKARLWAEELASAGLETVGTGEGAVPWRYTCRLPGIDWNAQHELAEAMRGRGVNVSHWYLPAHWMFGEPAGSLPGSEQLSREVFQFWVDAATSEATVREHAAIAASVVRSGSR